jgi:hypothetical protein
MMRKVVGHPNIVRYMGYCLQVRAHALRALSCSGVGLTGWCWLARSRLTSVSSPSSARWVRWTSCWRTCTPSRRSASSRLRSAWPTGWSGCTSTTSFTGAPLHSAEQLRPVGGWLAELSTRCAVTSSRPMCWSTRTSAPRSATWGSRTASRPPQRPPAMARRARLLSWRPRCVCVHARVCVCTCVRLCVRASVCA